MVSRITSVGETETRNLPRVAIGDIQRERRTNFLRVRGVGDRSPKVRFTLDLVKIFSPLLHFHLLGTLVVVLVEYVLTDVHTVANHLLRHIFG